MRSTAKLILGGVSRKFLTQSERRCVLQMGAADFHQVVPLPGFVVEDFVEALQRRNQSVVQLLHRGNVHRRGEGVVGRLAQVAVVVWMHRSFGTRLAAQPPDGEVGDDLVGVHVSLGAGAGLPDDQRKVVVKSAVDYLRRRRDDGRADFFIEQSLGHVDAGGAAFDHRQRPNQWPRHPLAADAEVSEGALGLRPP